MEGDEGVAKIGYCLESFLVGRTSRRVLSALFHDLDIHLVANVADKLNLLVRTI